jgi:serine protease inhibitor
LQLLYELGKHQRQYVLRIGSLALFSDRLNVSRRFRTGVREHYHGSVLNLNFRKSRQTLDMLNNWIRSITANRSQGLFRERVRPDTQLLLLNAIYFQGEWKVPFQSLKQKRIFHNQLVRSGVKKTASHGHVFQQPSDSSFQISSRSSDASRNRTVRSHSNEADRCWTDSMPELAPSEVNMMATTGQLPYASLMDGHVQAVRVPYVGGLGMYMFVPDGQLTVAAMLARLNSSLLETWIRSMTSTSVELLMPRFRVEQTYELRPLLSRLGLSRLLDGEADFSRVFAGTTSADQPQISSAVHRAMLEVNEHGTKASASTAFQSFTVSAFQGQRMHVDRPFVFIVRDDVRAVNLFVGSLCSFV